MTDTSTSSMDPLVSSGVDPKTAEAISKLVEKAVNNAVEKAVRSLGIAAQSRPQETIQLPASKVSIGWAGISALIAAVGVILGAVYWLNDGLREDLRFGIGSVRGEISDLRKEMHADLESIRAEFGVLRAEFGVLGAEVGDLREQMIRFDMLIQDRLPSAP